MNAKPKAHRDEPLRLDVCDLESVNLHVSGNVALPDFLCEGTVTREVMYGTRDLTDMERDYSAYHRYGGDVEVICDRQLNIFEGPPATTSTTTEI
jgi:hypothetical protein